MNHQFTADVATIETNAIFMNRIDRRRLYPDEEDGDDPTTGASKDMLVNHIPTSLPPFITKSYRMHIGRPILGSGTCFHSPP